MVVGPWIGLNMARHSAYIEAFWLCTGVSIVSIVLALIVAVPPVIRHADGSKPKLGFAAMFDQRSHAVCHGHLLYDLCLRWRFCFPCPVCPRIRSNGRRE